MPPKPCFSEGEKILCFHGPLLYEAKCLKVAYIKSGGVRYLVHYQGWNKSWDEWVYESRILKYNDANVHKQKDLSESHKYVYSASNAAKNKSKLKNKKGSGEPNQPMVIEKGIKQKLNNDGKISNKEQSKSKRPKIEPHVEPEECYTNKLEIRIKIPDELKPLLMEDWDLIVRQKKLCKLPSSVPVDAILSDYISIKKSSKLNAAKEATLIEVTNGFKEYFNVMLGSQLLYKFERSQYQQFIHENKDKEPSSFYGFIHLLRLFARLGGILAYTALDEKEIQLLLSHIHDFLKFMAKSMVYYSTNDYDFVSTEYQKKAVQ
ncbi:mortality factor 4-like protein 1 [Panonychus citri]|uniref:mortality factor 4-like protein 1 n=1 Tax=Panonychus citri TaxID=50023 RepID=UPI002306F9C4|nr:mortality factor 4-like protein 1 [Panonychus citri]